MVSSCYLKDYRLPIKKNLKKNEPLQFCVYKWSLIEAMEEINISKNALFSGIILLVAGFVLMATRNETYSFTKITLAPVVIMTAFGLIAFSAMGKKRKNDV